MSDPLGSLLQLADQLGHIVGQCHGLRESLLFGPRGRELGLETGDIGIVLRKLRGNLVSDLAEHHVEDAFTQYVPLKVIDQRVFDFGHRLLHGNGADRVAALVMLRASVAKNAIGQTAVCEHACGRDSTTARAALRDARERILCRIAAVTFVGTTCREHLVHREPRRIIDDPPLRQLDDHDVARIRFHANRGSALSNLLDSAMDVHTAISRVQKDRADRARCPRTTAAPASSWTSHTFVVQRYRDLFLTSSRQVLAIDALDNLRLCFIHYGDREAAACAIGLAFELVAVARATRDPSLSNATAKSFARARANRLELHLMAGALDEGRCLIDRVRELNLLTGRVVVELTAAIANQIANDERHLDRIAAESRLIATDDDVATFRFREELAQTRASEKVIARTTIVHVVDARLVRQLHTRDHLVATLGLDVEAELLLALVVLGPPSIRPDHHVVPSTAPVGIIRLRAARRNPSSE
ncbi:MAG: hypothetical protein QM831_31415 [Kofleriaceae bacterium]